jgi:hypothetical protein
LRWLSRGAEFGAELCEPAVTAITNRMHAVKNPLFTASKLKYRFVPKVDVHGLSQGCSKPYLKHEEKALQTSILLKLFSLS